MSTRVHEGRLFDFPGRGYGFEHAVDDAYPVVLAAVRALSGVLEATVAECMLDDFAGQRATYHIASSPLGGAYIRDPARTVLVPVVDEAALLAWLDAITGRSAANLASLAINDGWYFVDAAPGDVVRLRENGSPRTLPVALRRGGAAVRAPGDGLIVPMIGVDIDRTTGRLWLAVHGSPWTDEGGVGRACFDRLLAQLAAAGWRLVHRPDAADLAPPQHIAPVVARAITPSSPRAEPEAVAWVTLPPTRVVLGITATEREQLADVLVAMARAEFDAAEDQHFREFDAARARREILGNLATALGHATVDVARCEIMKRPVTYGMWNTYLRATNSAPPADWPDHPERRADAPIVGVSQREAAAFAAFYGASLPTEAEWQLAAAGGDRRWFPWGSTLAANQHQYVSPLGVEQMACGFSEYTSDRFEPYAGGDPGAFAEPGLGCLRGDAPGVPPCIPARRGLAANRRYRFATFRCVRRG